MKITKAVREMVRDYLGNDAHYSGRNFRIDRDGNVHAYLDPDKRMKKVLGTFLVGHVTDIAAEMGVTM